MRLQKSIWSGVFNPIVDCGIKSYNFLTRELYYIHFSGYFPKFSVQQFQNTLMRAPVTKFRRVLAYSYVLVKTWLHQRQLLQIFGDKIIPTKNVCEGYLFWFQPTIFLRKHFLVEVARQVTVENIKFETRGCGLQS